MTVLLAEEQAQLRTEDGRLAALLSFPRLKPGVVKLDRLLVVPPLLTQEALDRLLPAVLDQLSAQGKTAVLTCPQVQRWFPAHPEYAPLLSTGVKAKPSY